MRPEGMIGQMVGHASRRLVMVLLPIAAVIILVLTPMYNWFLDPFGDADCAFEKASGSCITLESICSGQSHSFSFPG